MLLSSSNRKYPPFPFLSLFSVVVYLRCLLHHILSLIAYTFRENREFVFIIIVKFMMSANIRIRFGLQIVLVCLSNTSSHYHHCANLSEGIELIKCLSDIFCRVCKIKHILSVIHYAICGVVWFQFTHFPCDDWENIYTLSYYHHQIGSMNYYPLFRVMSWNNGVRCMSFYILSFFWIWTSGLAFGKSVPPTTNVLHSNQWVSLYKLWNSCSWSESMRNLELKWPCICTSRPNSNVLTHEVFRTA